jgi:hypothetical protein
MGEKSISGIFFFILCLLPSLLLTILSLSSSIFSQFSLNQMDGRILLLERTGHFQLDQMMKSSLCFCFLFILPCNSLCVKGIRIYSFMLNRFRLMERILGEVRRSEMATGQRQSAILVMDLDGLQFHASLVAFISGNSWGGRGWHFPIQIPFFPQAPIE